MTNLGFTWFYHHKLGLCQQRIHILDSRQPTLECMHNKIGMYPLAAGNLQWQWTFTSFNKQFVPMSFINSWQGQVFFHDTRTEKCQRAGESTYPNGSKRMQRDPNGLLQEETNTLFGTHPFVWMQSQRVT